MLLQILSNRLDVLLPFIPQDGHALNENEHHLHIMLLQNGVYLLPKLIEDNDVRFPALQLHVYILEHDFKASGFYEQGFLDQYLTDEHRTGQHRTGQHLIGEDLTGQDRTNQSRPNPSRQNQCRTNEQDHSFEIVNSEQWIELCASHDKIITLQ